MDGKSIRNKLIGSDEERAVSPVIGVILMVAITVILAAVIAAFVLDLQPGGSQAPQANYDWSSNSEKVELTHSSGDDIDMSYVEIKVESGSDTGTAEFTSSEFSVGDTMAFEPKDTTKDSDLEVTLGGTPKTVAIDSTNNLKVGDAEDIDKITLTWSEGDGGSILTDYEP